MLHLSNQPCVLVLDADLPPALSIARSLHRLGVRVDVASSEGRPLAGFSRAVVQTKCYPNPLTAPDYFMAWLSEQMAHSGYALVIPVTERTLSPILESRAGLDDSRVAMAPTDALRIALDKARTVALAQGLGIQVPKSYPVNQSTDIDSLASVLCYPVVIKPISSFANEAQSGGPRRHLTVQYARDLAELRVKLRQFPASRAVLQEYCPGRGVGIELIADQGRILYAFQHERMHELPLTGGGSCLRRSVPVDPNLLDAAARLMTELKWHGVAMVEFKVQPETGRYCLMEINGRFWGSLPLAVAAGADFPAMLFELLTQGRVQPRPPARDGVVCRNLTRDAYWYETLLRGQHLDGPVRTPDRGQMLRDAWLVFSPRHCFDVQQWRDPLPGIVEVGRLCGTYFERGRDYLLVLKDRWVQRRAWRTGKVAGRLREARHLLFICYGNINRSAVAQVIAEAHLPKTVTVQSAGFHPEAGRPADPTMVAIARERGYDLSSVRSRVLDETMLNQADVVFVMEIEHLQRIKDGFPRGMNKIFLLGGGCHRQFRQIEIPDPYGRDKNSYLNSFKMILESIQKLAVSIE